MDNTNRKTTCCIEFIERPAKTFNSGDLLRGRVTLGFLKEKTVKGSYYIYLKFYFICFITFFKEYLLVFVVMLIVTGVVFKLQNHTMDLNYFYSIKFIYLGMIHPVR